MNIMVITIGTAGDVYPMIGIARKMRELGHQVHIASMPQYAGSLERAGYRFHPLDGIPELSDSPDYYHPTRSMHLVAERLLIPAMKPVYELLAPLDPAEWALIANCHCYGARVAQERRGFYLASCVVSPFSLKSAERMPVTPGLACPSWAPVAFRRAFLNFVSRLWDRELAPAVNGFRNSLGLSPARNLWYEWSLSPERVIGFFPEWFAQRARDWPPQFVYGGFTVFDPGLSQEVPAPLREDGPPLVVFTAGSAGGAAIDFFDAAVAASDGQPWRVVLLTGKETCDTQKSLPDTVYRFAYVPLSELLPLTSISLALCAGVPQIAVPFGHDQFDNSARIARLGVGQTLVGSRNLPLRLRELIGKMLQDTRLGSRCREVRQTALLDERGPDLYGQIEADCKRRCVPCAGDPN